MSAILSVIEHFVVELSFDDSIVVSFQKSIFNFLLDSLLIEVYI